MSDLSVFSAATECPSSTALVCAEGTLSYFDLAQRVRERIEALEARGTSAPGRAFGLSPSPTLESLVSIYASFELGRPLVLLHPRLTAAERARALSRVPGLVDLDASSTGIESSAGFPWELDAAERGDERALALFFTSGTSGRPKLAVLSRRAFMRSAQMSASKLRSCARDRWLLSIPLAHVGGLSILTRSLMARGAIVLPSLADSFDPNRAVADLFRHEVTLVSWVPTMLERVLEAGLTPPAALRTVLLGGAPARSRTLESAARAGWPIVVTYGLTEACSQVSTTPLGHCAAAGMGSGHPLHGVDLRIVDGEIWIRGANLSSGYLEGESVLPITDDEGWFATGDLGRLDEFGRLHVDARRTDLILSGGENLYPREIELAFEAQVGVSEVLVVGVQDEQWGERPVALVVPNRDYDESTVRLGLERALASHKRPKVWLLAEALPRNALGKLDRVRARALAETELAQSRKSATSPVRPG